MCTRVFWSDNSVAKVVSRTMDWLVSDDPVLWAVPEGTRRAAGDAAWESRFGVVGLSMWDSGTTDAVNSAGLAAHVLYLGTAGFAAPGSPAAHHQPAVGAVGPGPLRDGGRGSLGAA
jgi:penicillin V acylase-like amidase (Ntn superfamily)